MTEEQFTAEYQAGHRRLLGFVSLKVRSPELAEDIASQTWLKAWRCRYQYNGSSGFLTWVTTIAFNLIREHWRRRDVLKNAEDLSSPAVTLSARTPDPSDALEVERLLQRLKVCDRAILKMRFVAGLSVEEAAAQMGMPANTLKVKTFRALRQMAVIR